MTRGQVGLESDSYSQFLNYSFDSSHHAGRDWFVGYLFYLGCLAFDEVRNTPGGRASRRFVHVTIVTVSGG